MRRRVGQAAAARLLPAQGRSGIWTWLPLGLNVLNKIENIIREEMASIDAQEVHFSGLLPRERMRPPTAGRNTATTSSV